MKYIYEIINPYLIKYPSFLVGDFNSLTRRDYDDTKWKEIYEIRKQGKWELPVHNLTDQLGLQWMDSGKYHYQDTCRYNTRIDYI